jgi:hypothetical protein
MLEESPLGNYPPIKLPPRRDLGFPYLFAYGSRWLASAGKPTMTDPDDYKREYNIQAHESFRWSSTPS